MRFSSRRQSVIPVSGPLRGWTFLSSVPFQSRLWRKSPALVHPEYHAFHNPRQAAGKTTGKISFPSPIIHFKTSLPVEMMGDQLFFNTSIHHRQIPLSCFNRYERLKGKAYSMDSCVTLTEIGAPAGAPTWREGVQVLMLFLDETSQGVPHRSRRCREGQGVVRRAPKPCFRFWIQALSPTVNFCSASVSSTVFAYGISW